MQPAGDHDVPGGPLAVRWLAYELPTIRAGALATPRVAVENAGTATWAPTGPRRVCLGYHWLDELGNPIVWDGLWTALPHEVRRGGRAEADLTLRGPIPPGRYRLAIDLVAEDRYWFSEVGNVALERAVDVRPRIERRALALHGAETEAAEVIAYLAPGVVPGPEWEQRVLDAHAEGYAVVGGSIDAGGGVLRRPPRALAPYAPGSGRIPGFAHPLLCPSVVRGVEPEWLDPVEGLPALEPPADEPWLYDGRIELRLRARPRSGRRHG
ncbi:MAG TPA: hypothetical protein VF101_11280 [Gaiellaceae bacterium]